MILSSKESVNALAVSRKLEPVCRLIKFYISSINQLKSGCPYTILSLAVTVGHI